MNKKTATSLSTALAALFFFVVLPIFPGCAGGCGEEASNKPAADNGAPGMGSAPKSGGGSAGLDKRNRYDSAGKKSSGTATGELGDVAEDLTSGPVKTVGPEDFKGKVLRPGSTVFLTVVRSSCEDCDAIIPVVKALAPQFTGKFEFMQFDGAAVGASGLLPPKMSLEPLPAFALYKNGKATSVLQGMPFPREVDAKGAYKEPLADYQRRLMRWFHDALTQRNLNFSQTLHAPPRKKT